MVYLSRTENLRINKIRLGPYDEKISGRIQALSVGGNLSFFIFFFSLVFPGEKCPMQVCISRLSFWSTSALA